jgi:hypothetical protein
LHAITGQYTGTNELGAGLSGWATQDFIVLGTGNPGDSMILPDHAYAVLGYTPDGADILYNPWGINGNATFQGHQVYGSTFTNSATFVVQNFIAFDYAYPGAWNQMSYAREAVLMADAARKVVIDVCIAGLDEEQFYCSSIACQSKLYQSTCVLGLDAAQHLARCRELSAEGYLPAAISVVRAEGSC